ncbi:MAG: ATP synthase F1 subunit delta [Lachnospiraceae bacterium]|nr:ATP synthase F1 subunit delta [Lachnospiraceae bacterium]
MAKLITKTYGDALFDVAVENKSVSELDREAAAVIDIIGNNPEFLKLLKHPNVTKEEKVQVIETVFAPRVSGEMYGFLRVLVDKDRQGQVVEILQYFTERVKEYRRIGVVYITSALPLGADQKKKIEKKVLETSGFAALEPHYSVDEKLIGGLVIRIGDRVVDGSVRHKLDQLTRDLRNITGR